MVEMLSPDRQIGYVAFGSYTDWPLYQFYRVAPEGIVFVSMQADLESLSEASLQAALGIFWQRVEVLASKRVDAIVLGGSEIAAQLGRARVVEVLRRVEDETGIPAVSDLEAMVSVSRGLGASRPALAVPCSPVDPDLVSEYLALAGVPITHAVLGPRSPFDETRGQPMRQHLMALQVGRRALESADGADALLMPGNRFFSVHAAAELEAAFGVPVLTDPVTSLRSCLDLWGQGAERLPASSWTSRVLPGA